MPLVRYDEKRTIALADEYVKLSSVIKQKSVRAEEIKDELKNLVTNRGKQADNSRILTVGNLSLVNTYKVTAKLKDDAPDIIKRLAPDLASRLLITVEVVREDLLQELIQKERIPEPLIKELFEVTRTPSFTVKR